MTITGRVTPNIKCVVPLAELRVHIFGPLPKSDLVGISSVNPDGEFKYIAITERGKYRVELKNERGNKLLDSVEISNMESNDRFSLSLRTCKE